MEKPKRTSYLRKLTLHGQLLSIMLATALAAVVLCALIFGITFSRTTRISSEVQQNLTDNVHFMLDMLIAQQEVHIKGIYAQQGGTYIDEMLEGITAKTPDWQELARDAYELIDSSEQFDDDVGLLDSLGAILFIYYGGEFYLASDTSVEKDEFLRDITAFYDEAGMETDLYEDLAETGPFNTFSYGDDRKILVWRTFDQARGRLGLLVPMVQSQASEALSGLMESETAQMKAETGQAVTGAVVVLLISAVILVVALVAITPKLSGVIAVPVETELQRAATEMELMEKLDRLKTEFLGNISHELKTPLTVMSGYAQTSEAQLLADPENQELAGKMKIISSEAERLSLMVSQLLDITRIEEGRMAINPGPCRIDEIIQITVDTHYAILNKGSNRLTLQIASELPKVFGDPQRLMQVLLNLISNAIRHTQMGEIVISARRSGHFVEVTVADNGRGIDEQLLHTIFDRYSSKSPADDDINTGTGLGLFICKHIIESHGGQMTVESVAGRGSTFVFTVPIAD